MDYVDVISSIVQLGVMYATPLALASSGEVISERAGVINLGIEGIMLMSAFVGVHVAYVSGDAVLGYLIGTLAGAALGLLLALLSVIFRLDQVIAGMGIYFLGFGLSDFLFRSIYGTTTVYVTPLPRIGVPLLDDVPVIGQGFFVHDPVVYLSYAVVALTWLFVFRTKWGLALRAVGENPKAADSMGINVTKTKVLAVVACSSLAGLAGAQLGIGVTNTYYENLTYGMGFIAVGLVYFGRWEPVRAFVGALIFGLAWSVASTLQPYFIGIGRPEMSYLLLMLPYLLIVIFLVIISRGTKGPAWLGRPYFRE
ncbi:MAG: ABC transporter permease [Desulfurococcaceae archaeon]